MQYLELARPAAVWFHVPNGEKRDARTAAILKQMGVRPGVADLVFLCVPPACIELKTPTGRQSPPQAEFEAECSPLGVRYAVCRSVGEVAQALALWGLVRPGRVKI